MDRKALARKLREALFDHIETEHRDALQDDAVDALFEKVLASCERTAPLVDIAAQTCRTWTTSTPYIATQKTCDCKPDTTNCGICWDKTATPAIGDVDLNTASVYAYKDGIAQWVSIHDLMFDAALAATKETA